jgi:energy-coupling factor transporter ATP-binding protein EcfA2
VSLLQRYRAGSTGTLLADIEHLVTRVSATGAMLDDDNERWEAQGFLDYWLAMLYRNRRTPIDGTLKPFDAALAPELPDDRCPYRGLEAFREQQHGMFFGRTRVIAEMLARISTGRLLIVVGPSGSGKSSLVLAGLVPVMKQGGVHREQTHPGSEEWQYLPPLLPGAHPLVSLASLIAPGATGEALQQDALRASEPQYLTRALDARGRPAVVIVDQFEEVFTLCGDDAERWAFVENLLTATRSSGPPHRVVLTVRSDFEPQVAAFPALQDIYNSVHYRVPPFNAAELREVIEKPAELVGLKFEAGIVDRLVSEILGEPAGLPLLQFALLKLWEHRDRNRVTLEAYRAVGGPLKALERSAEEMYGRLLPEEQVTARRILMKIVRPGSSLEITSNRIRRDSVQGNEPRERVDRVLDKLIAAGLLRPTGGPDPAEVQIEVAHEALLRNWPRLVDWLDEERVRLRRRFGVTTAAQQWAAHGKDPGGLFGGSLLEEAKGFDDLDPVERAFIAASQEAIESRARREKLIFRALVALLILVLGVSAVLAIVALQLRQALAGERQQRNGLELALREADNLVAQRSQALEEARRWADAATRAVQAASLAAAAIDQGRYQEAKSLIRETQQLSDAYGNLIPDPAPPPTGGADPQPPSKGVPTPAPVPDKGGSGGAPIVNSVTPRRSTLWEGLEIRASAEQTKGVVKDTSLPVYQFKIWLEGPPDALAKVTSVQYEFDHPSFRDKIQRSQDRANRFEQGYLGWGCLSSVKVTVTGQARQATVDFDMCAAVQFRYKKQE